MFKFEILIYGIGRILRRFLIDKIDKNKEYINQKLTEASRIQSSRQKTGRTDYQCVFCLKLINLPLKL